MIHNPVILPIIDNELFSALNSSIELVGKWLAFVLVSESQSRLYVKAMNFSMTKEDVAEIRTPPLGVLSNIDTTKSLPTGTSLRIYKAKIFDNEEESDDWIDAQTNLAFIKKAIKPYLAMGYGFESEMNRNINLLNKYTPTLSEMDARIHRDPSGQPYSKYSYGKW